MSNHSLVIFLVFLKAEIGARALASVLQAAS